MGWSTSEKKRAYQTKWREQNKANVQAAQRKYYAANKEECNARVRKCQAAKKEKYLAQTVAWQKENPEKVAAIRKRSYQKHSAKEIARVRRRQGRIKHCEIFMNQAELVEIQGMYDFCKLFKGFEVDHIIPLNGQLVSGLHVLSNLQILRVNENRSKSNRYTI